ncbi:MAG: Maf family protein [Verrucomicrobiae bacterium]|nr:Maf family protein [Verrucomicrobiae bacterium]
MRIVLASSSPRRRELLGRAGSMGSRQTISASTRATRMVTIISAPSGAEKSKIRVICTELL